MLSLFPLTLRHQSFYQQQFGYRFLRTRTVKSSQVKSRQDNSNMIIEIQTKNQPARVGATVNEMASRWRESRTSQSLPQVIVLLTIVSRSLTSSASVSSSSSSSPKPAPSEIREKKDDWFVAFTLPASERAMPHGPDACNSTDLSNTDTTCQSIERVRMPCVSMWTCYFLATRAKL